MLKLCWVKNDTKSFKNVMAKIKLFLELVVDEDVIDKNWNKEKWKWN